MPSETPIEELWASFWKVAGPGFPSGVEPMARLLFFSGSYAFLRFVEDNIVNGPEESMTNAIVELERFQMAMRKRHQEFHKHKGARVH